MPKKIQNFAKSALVKPVTINVGRAGAASLDVIQVGKQSWRAVSPVRAGSGKAPFEADGSGVGAPPCGHWRFHSKETFLGSPALGGKRLLVTLRLGLGDPASGRAMLVRLFSDPPN